MSGPSHTPIVAVVGRPNVGKSTFFNRVLGRRIAIVEDQPGVTRDRNFSLAEWAGRSFWIVDTGGLITDDQEPMTSAIREQVMVALEEADALVFVVDGKVGPHPLDEKIAGLLRRTDLPVVLAVNKMDRMPEDTSHNDFWTLGLGEPHPVSSISGKGSGDLLDAVVAALPEAPGEEAKEGAIQVAVIGKPNVGKSSFINRLLNQNRLVVSDVAGTTRDSIDTPMRYHGHDLVFIDTAGLRRQARIKENLEYYSTLRTERAIERADVCLLLIDATEELHVQDMKVAEKAWEAGRGLIIVVNKWDLVEKETNTAAAFERHLRERAPSLRWVPVVFTSALTGQRVHNTLDMILEVAEERKRRVPTSVVNEALESLAARQQPPHLHGRPVRLLYGTQAAVEPPTFVIFTTQPKGITESYARYLHNGFRERWSFTGTPIRLRFRGRREQR